jgi:hypothetical protein
MRKRARCATISLIAAYGKLAITRCHLAAHHKLVGPAADVLRRGPDLEQARWHELLLLLVGGRLARDPERLALAAAAASSSSRSSSSSRMLPRASSCSGTVRWTPPLDSVGGCQVGTAERVGASPAAIGGAKRAPGASHSSSSIAPRA